MLPSAIVIFSSNPLVEIRLWESLNQPQRFLTLARETHPLPASDRIAVSVVDIGSDEGVRTARALREHGDAPIIAWASPPTRVERWRAVLALGAVEPHCATLDSELLELRVADCVRRSRALRQAPDELVSALWESKCLRNQLSIERDLRSEIDRQALVLRQMGEGLHVCDERWNIVYANDSLGRMFRRESSRMIGTNMIVLSQDEPAVRASLAEAMATARAEGAWDGPLCQARFDGTTFWAHVRINCELMDGRPHFIVVQEDITQRKHATEALETMAVKLETSNRALEEFAGVVSHDLREPLRMISSFLTLLETKYDAAIDQEGREFIAFAVDGARRMKGLIDALLEYARLGARPPEPVSVDCNGILADVKNNLRAAIQETDATIESVELPTLLGEPRLLTQVFQNLIANAIKFRSLARPVIKVEVEARGGEWRFAVRDNGVGFDMRDAERVFMVFQRLQRDVPGLGIGLATCKKVVERHGGSIWVESQPERGTVVYFTLPQKAIPIAAGMRGTHQR